MTALDYVRENLSVINPDIYEIAEAMEKYSEIKNSEQTLQLQKLEILVNKFNAVVDKIPVEHEFES